MARNDLDQLALRWQHAAQNAPRVARETLTTAAIMLVGYIKQNKLSGDPIKRRSGNLSAHITYEMAEVEDGSVARVGVLRGVPYARGLEEGNPPHIIRPNLGMVDFSSDHYSQRPRMLRFIGRNGNVVFTREVHHPGNKPFRFLRSSLQENKVKIEEQFKKRMLADAAGAKP